MKKLRLFSTLTAIAISAIPLLGGCSDPGQGTVDTKGKTVIEIAKKEHRHELGQHHRSIQCHRLRKGVFDG